MHQIFRYVPVAVGWLVVASVVGGCAQPVPYDPFKVPREELRNEIHTIALVPIVVASAVVDPEIARERLEPSLIGSLEGTGLRVLDSAIWADLWREVGTDIGEIYDASTGKVDKERHEIVRQEVYRLLEVDHGADAILYVSITTIDLQMTWAAQLEFCGGSRPAYWPGGWIGSWDDRATLIIAACLSASLQDFDDQQLYGIRTALEVVETYAHQTREIRPRDERFVDKEQIAEAIEQVIGPMVENFRSPTNEGSKPSQ